MPLSAPDLAYHLRQYDDPPYRSTVQFADFIRTVAGSLEGVVDCGCGAGANIHWLSRWAVIKGAVGLDLDGELVAVARERNPEALFMQADVVSPWVASYALSIQTLSFVEDWRPMLAKIVEQTRRWAFVTSLFWDGIETHTHVGDKHYNVIDVEEFARVAAANGAREIIWQIPEVDREIARPPRGQMGTYTEAGLQFSGPLLMPWRFAALRMS